MTNQITSDIAKTYLFERRKHLYMQTLVGDLRDYAKQIYFASNGDNFGGADTRRRLCVCTPAGNFLVLLKLICVAETNNYFTCVPLGTLNIR